MQYRDSKGKLDTPKKILKVNHPGEFGDINIYKSQIVVCRIFMKPLVPLLESFLADEKRHLAIFWQEIQSRNGGKEILIYSYFSAEFKIFSFKAWLEINGYSHW